VTESGAGAFSLAVQGSTEETLFADAALMATTSTEVAGIVFTPYAEVGVRHRIEGDRPMATARFVGLTGTDSVSVEGVGYGRTVTRLGAGFGLDISRNVRLNGGYGYETGKNDRHSVTGGLSIRF
jgi:outer membrane autotransporter protein